MPHATTEYAMRAVYDHLVVCAHERASCARHLRDLERVGSPDFPYVFDETRADRIVKFFSACRHVRGPFAGQPITLDDWQKFDYGCVFGWVHKDTGVRRFKTAYSRIARGNAKSTGLSGVALYGMTSDALYPPGCTDPSAYVYENMPEVVCGAADREQAGIVWGDAREMAMASPEIARRLDIKKGAISHVSRSGGLKKLSKDTKNKDGGSPCIIIIDEYHTHRNSLIKDILASGKGKRRQCLEWIITTAGEDSVNNPCRTEDDIAKKVLAGEIVDDTYWAMIREIDDGDDPHDPSLWVKANPILRSGSEYADTLRAAIQSEHDLAFGSGDRAKIRQWMIKRVDRWQSESADKYFDGCLDTWDELAVSRDEFNRLTKGRSRFVGLDLSKSIDLTALGSVFRLDDGRYAVTATGFIPEDAILKHEHTDRVPYADWVREGWCVSIPGAVIDDRHIRGHMYDTEQDRGWSVAEFCYDPCQARQMAAELEEEGYVCVETRQGAMTLSEPTKRFRELVMQGRIVHDGSPALRWCLTNAYEVQDNNGNIKLNKKTKDDSQRIDLAAAVMNAMHRAIVQKDKRSAYADRGLRSLG